MKIKKKNAPSVIINFFQRNKTSVGKKYDFRIDTSYLLLKLLIIIQYYENIIHYIDNILYFMFVGECMITYIL